MNTSAILLLAVAVWLFWVMPLLWRRRRPALATAAAPFSGARDTRPTQMMQEASMEHSSSDAHAGPRSSPPAPFTIRWGRTTLALVGVLALLAAAISGALLIFSLGSVAVAWGGVVVFGAVIATLRSLAIRDRRRRKLAAALQTSRFRTTADPAAATVAGGAVGKATEVFDGAAGESAAAPVEKRLTAEELRKVALRVAAQGAADAKLAHTMTLAEGELDGEPWEPVEVPKPGYVTAAKAAKAPAPDLVAPEEPKASTKVSIKADQAGIGAPTGDAPSVVESTAGASAADSASSDALPAKPASGLSNLDVVLRRRRA